MEITGIISFHIEIPLENKITSSLDLDILSNINSKEIKIIRGNSSEIKYGNFKNAINKI